MLGANGSGKSTLVRAMLGLVPLTVAARCALFGTPLARVPRLAARRLRAAAGHRRRPACPPRSARWWPPAGSPAAGLLPAAPRRPRGGRGARSRPSAWPTAPRRRRHPVRRPAAAGAHRPRAGRRARPAGPRRADRRGRPAAASRRSPTSSRRLVGRGTTIVLVAHELGPLAPLIDRARGDARRPGRVRRTAARRVHRRRRARARPPPPRPATGGATTRRAVRAPLDPTGGAGDDEPARLRLHERALLAALVTGLAAPAVGTYLVQRRLALMGDGIGHVAVTGVALGPARPAPPRRSPRWSSRSSAPCVIELIREPRPHQRRRRPGAAVLRRHRRRRAAHRARRAERRHAATRYLFGSITTIAADATCGSSSALARRRRGRSPSGSAPQLFAVAQDQEFARVAGLDVRVLQPAGLGAGRRDRHRGDAHRRPAAGQRADGGAGRDRPAADPRRSATTLLAAMGLGMVASVGGVLRLGVRRRRPGRDDRAARARRLRRGLAGRGAGCGAGAGWRAPFPEPADAFDLGEAAHRRARGRTRTSTARTAATRPCRTATTSTTSTTGTGTPRTGATMTSTEPRRCPQGARPTRQRRAVVAGPAELRRLPQRPGHPRPAAAQRRERRAVDGLPHPAGARRRRRGRRAAHRGRRGGLPALQREPPPPPGLPRLRPHRRGRGPGRRAVGRRRSPASTASPTSATPWRSSAPAPPADPCRVT